MTPMVNCVTTAPPNLSDSQPPKGRTIEPSSGPRNAYKATDGAFRLRHSVLSGVCVWRGVRGCARVDTQVYVCAGARERKSNRERERERASARRRKRERRRGLERESTE